METNTSADALEREAVEQLTRIARALTSIEEALDLFAQAFTANGRLKVDVTGNIEAETTNMEL